MATLIIRNLSTELIARLKKAAVRNHRSIEQEVRELLEQRFMCRASTLKTIRQRLKDLPAASAAEIDCWIAAGRARKRTRSVLGK